MNRYRVLLPLQVQPREGGSYSQHEEFASAFTEDEETENLKNGLLEIIPQRYEVIGGSDVYEIPPGQQFERGLPLGIEALLVEGGHIKRVEKPAKTSAAKKS